MVEAERSHPYTNSLEQHRPRRATSAPLFHWNILAQYAAAKAALLRHACPLGRSRCWPGPGASLQLLRRKCLPSVSTWPW